MNRPPGKGESRVAAAVRQATGIAVAQTHQIAQYGAIALEAIPVIRHKVGSKSRLTFNFRNRSQAEIKYLQYKGAVEGLDI